MFSTERAVVVCAEDRLLREAFEYYIDQNTEEVCEACGCFMRPHSVMSSSVPSDAYVVNRCPECGSCSYVEKGEDKVTVRDGTWNS